MTGQQGDIFTEDGRRLEAHELPSTRAGAGEEFDDLIIRVGTDPITQRALSVSAQPAAHGAGVSLDVDVPGEPLVAKVDGPRLRQVIDNLLGNAVKYTEPGGSLTVRLRQRDEVVELAVSDTGIGVAPDEVGRLFRRFFRGTQAKQRHIPGAGLGLSIVRAIVEAHGGLVSVDSIPAEGSTFRVELPLTP
jgi:signal transduction histidine kinase